MICKYCGSQLSGNVCSSCKKAAVLSYTSHELADLLGIGIVNNQKLNEEQLQSAYNSGFDAGQKRGYAKGFDSAQKESAQIAKKQLRFFIIAAAGGAVVLALISSIATGALRYNTGYRDGIIVGKQEQKTVDESLISGSYQDGYDDGYAKGQQAGYEQGLLVTPTPTSEPTPTLKPTPTPQLFVLETGSKGAEVRELQKRLISLGYLAADEVDGDFGPKTENAVKQFQINNGTNPTGTVNQGLWTLIMSDDAIAATPDTQLTPPSLTIEPNETTPSGIGTGENVDDITQTTLIELDQVKETDRPDYTARIRGNICL